MQLEFYEEANAFSFGSSGREETNRAAKIPAMIGCAPGHITAAAARGDAPLLLGKPLLKALRGR
eukprot:6075558-Pyramimonas_sp.AAC.1